MKKAVYHLDLEYHERSQSFVVKNDCFIIGNSEKADFVISSDKEEDKIILKIQNDDLLIKINDSSYAIESSGKFYTSLRIKEESTLKCGPLTIKCSVQYIETEDEEELIISGNSCNTQLPPSPPSPVFFSNKEVKSQLAAFHSAELVNSVNSGSSINFNSFNIQFDEMGIISSSIPYETKNLCFKDYIDVSTPSSTPESNSLIKTQKGQSVHIVHIHNGTTLNDQYFPLSNSKVFLGNSGSGKSIFTAHDCGTKSSRLINIQDDLIHVIKQNGYEFISSDPEKQLSNITHSSYLLKHGKRVILSKGLSQIIIEIKKSPPLLGSENLLNVDNKLIKCLALSWITLFVPLIYILLVTETPVTENVIPENEIAIIYKRPDPEKVEIQIPEIEPLPEKVIAKEEKIVPKEITQVEVVKVEKVVAPSPAKIYPPPSPRAPKIVAEAPIQSAPKLIEAAPEQSSNAQVKKIGPSYSFNALAELSKDMGKINGSVKAIKNSSNVKLDHLVTGSDTSLAQSDTHLVGADSITKTITTNSYGLNEGTDIKGTNGLSRKVAAITSYRANDIKVLGSIDPSLIKKILREYIPQFRYCYQKELMHNPSVAGVFDLNFSIDESGRGKKVFVTQYKSKFSEKGVNCIGKVVAIISFPIPKGRSTVEVRQPLNFLAD